MKLDEMWKGIMKDTRLRQPQTDRYSHVKGKVNFRKCSTSQEKRSRDEEMLSIQNMEPATALARPTFTRLETFGIQKNISPLSPLRSQESVSIFD